MMSSSCRFDLGVTGVLIRIRGGDRLATQELFPLVYDELRLLAGKYLSRESAAFTIQPTALVHEAYIRLVGPGDSTWENRRHFFGAAATAIRRILTDHARAHRRAKRGAGVRPLPIDDTRVCVEDSTLDVLALDEVLDRLMQLDPFKAKVVELRFFAGLSMDEIGRTLGASPSSVAREWRFARVWLHRELAEIPVHDPATLEAS